MTAVGSRPYFYALLLSTSLMASDMSGWPNPAARAPFTKFPPSSMLNPAARNFVPHAAHKAFAPDFDLEIEKEDAVRNLFAHVIASLEGVKDEVLAGKSPRTLKQLNFESPGFDLEGYFPHHWSWYVPPEPDYPESMEELESWMNG